jgi:hydroxyethylthiazole kinase-like uncharacterized protein yjeF
MRPLVTADEARRLDVAIAKHLDVPTSALMETAGKGAAEAIDRWVSGRPSEFTILCGPGNNGGDGFAAARHLVARGHRVRLFLVGAIEDVRRDAREQAAAWVAAGGSITTIVADDPLQDLRTALHSSRFAVDALFGTGLSKAIVGIHARVVETLNNSGTPIVALDLPSGLDSDRGVVLGVAVVAKCTVCFGPHKRSLYTPTGKAHAGLVETVSLGADPARWFPGDIFVADESDVRFAPRPLATYKTRSGHVLVVAGSRGKAGAALLAARGAFRAGAGLVTIATWSDVAHSLGCHLPEAMIETLPADVDGACRRIEELADGKSALVVGPGFGANEVAAAVVGRVVQLAKPTVFDADALGCLAAAGPCAGPAVVTPHPGEAGRVLGTSATAVESDRFQAVRDLAKRMGATVLLKGRPTLVGSVSGPIVAIDAGSPAMAVAGSGDVLAGITGALLCALEPERAALSAAFVHAKAGELWATANGDRGLLASELADLVPQAIRASTGDD